MRRNLLKRLARKLWAWLAHSSCVSVVSGLPSSAVRRALCLRRLVSWSAVLLRSVSWAFTGCLGRPVALPVLWRLTSFCATSSFCSFPCALACPRRTSVVPAPTWIPSWRPGYTGHVGHLAALLWASPGLAGCSSFLGGVAPFCSSWWWRPGPPPRCSAHFSSCSGAPRHPPHVD